jgi:hypothetical protein
MHKVFYFLTIRCYEAASNNATQDFNSYQQRQLERWCLDRDSDHYINLLGDQQYELDRIY